MQGEVKKIAQQMDKDTQTVLDMRLTSDFSELRKSIRSLLK